MKSKRTKALSISMETKVKVWDRDGGACLWCGAHNAAPEAHYIPRFKGGLGIEQNVLTLCRKCHRIFDQPSTDAEVATSRRMRKYFKYYLEKCYPGFKDSDRYYHKE